MLAPTFVMLAALTVSVTPPPRAAAPAVTASAANAAGTAAPAAAAPAPVRRSRDASLRARPGGRARARDVDANELYSLRARRRLTAYLRMRLLEMREAGLERAAAVVERRLPVDALVPPLQP